MKTDNRVPIAEDLKPLGWLDRDDVEMVIEMEGWTSVYVDGKLAFVKPVPAWLAEQRP